MLDAKLQVLFVLFSERRNTEHSCRQIDPFMLAQQAAVDDLALNIVATNGADAKLDETISQRNSCSRLHFFGKGLECGGNQSGGAGDVARRDGDVGPRLERHWSAVLQSAGADLRPLQVLKDANGAAFVFGNLAYSLDDARVLFMSTVGKVESRHIHAEPHEVAQHGLRAAGRPQGADNLGLARQVS